MNIELIDAELRQLELATRFPFRYGIASMTRVPQVYLIARFRIDGVDATGISADLLPPKWFTKDPHTSYEADLLDMVRSIRAAYSLAGSLGTQPSAYRFWAELDRLTTEREFHALAPLLAQFGISLVERAMIDAVTRATGRSFFELARSNLLGVSLGDLYPSLASCQPGDLLPAEPLPRVILRHTVGLSDPLTQRGVTEDDRLDDGLPFTLEENIRTYGLTHFKVKLGGDLDRDRDRLSELVALLRNEVGEPCRVSLDGNEQFESIGAFRDSLDHLANDPAIAWLIPRILYIEQPLHRKVALEGGVRRGFESWPDRPPVIIDESDDRPTTLAEALDCGYSGVSHKNCKGVIKSIANACLLKSRQRAGLPSVFSGEDLANVGPVATSQDLYVASVLGITHVERNGHHYFAGLSAYPRPMVTETLSRLGSIYAPDDKFQARLRVESGHLDLSSLLASKFGTGVDPDTVRATLPAIA